MSTPPSPALDPAFGREWPPRWDGHWTPGPPSPSPPLTWRGARLNLILLALTTTTVFLAGALRLVSGPGGSEQWVLHFPDGLRMMAGVLSILISHEMGHYLACRYYRVDATLPFLLPAPPFLVGTFGALIRIKSPFPNRKALFDIGIAGPLAGFLVALPVLYLGVLEGRIGPSPPVSFGGFGEPLLFEWAVAWLKGPVPEGHTVYIGSWGMAAWFGLFITALNLIPVGQLDGGHVTYALFRRSAHVLSRVAFLGCVLLVYFGPNWILWSLLLLFIGRRHPPTLEDEPPVGRGRAALGALALLVFVVCFVPDPIQGSWEMIAELLAE